MKRFFRSALALLFVLSLLPPFSAFAQTPEEEVFTAVESEEYLAPVDSYLTDLNEICDVDELRAALRNGFFAGSVEDSNGAKTVKVDISSFSIPADYPDQLLDLARYTLPDLPVSSRIGYSYSSTKILYLRFYLLDGLSSMTAVNTLRARFLEAAEKLLADLRDNASLTDLEKALLLHDRLAALCAYDYDRYLAGTLPAVSYTAYGALLENVCVCQGYTLAYRYLLDELGIDNATCNSSAINHIWNIVYLDGTPYHVDVTWDDPTRDLVGRVNHRNFMLSSDGIAQTGHSPVDYDTTPNDTTYDGGSWWSSADSEIQYVNGAFWFFRGASLIRRQCGAEITVLTVSDHWQAGKNSYWSSCPRLSSAGGCLLYSTPTSIAEYNPATGLTRTVWTPDLSGAGDYPGIYGFSCRDNVMTCVAAPGSTGPNLSASVVLTAPYDPASAQAPEEVFTFSVLEGAATVTGYSGSSTVLEFPSTLGGHPVTAIGDHAFSGRTGLTAVAFPESLVEIGGGAFSDCGDLSLVILPAANMQTVGSDAFENCFALSGVYLSDLAGWCGTDFENDSANPLQHAHHLYVNGDLLTELVVPSNVVRVGDFAFWSNPDLTSVSIPGNTEIGNYSFAAAFNLSSVTIGDRVNSIGEYAFWFCPSLTSLSIGKGVKTIGASAFDGCTALTSVTLPDGLTGLGHSAFSGCTGLASIAIPGGVAVIGENAFNGCTALTSVTLANGVQQIAFSAFRDCALLASVTIPASVTDIVHYAFDGCTALTEVVYGGTRSQWNAIEIEDHNDPLLAAAPFNGATGDLNGDGYVTSADAIYLLYFTFYPGDYPVAQDCDFNGDGAVTSADAIYLLYFTFYPADYPLE